MEETRASMTEKLELLEERVRETLEETKSAVEDIVENVKGTVDETVGVVKETVDGAKSTVEDIVENVKGTMDDTVTTVKHTFDLSYQANQHPWVFFGGAVLVGASSVACCNPRPDPKQMGMGTDIMRMLTKTNLMERLWPAKRNPLRKKRLITLPHLQNVHPLRKLPSRRGHGGAALVNFRKS